MSTTSTTTTSTTSTTSTTVSEKNSSIVPEKNSTIVPEKNSTTVPEKNSSATATTATVLVAPDTVVDKSTEIKKIEYIELEYLLPSKVFIPTSKSNNGVTEKQISVKSAKNDVKRYIKLDASFKYEVRFNSNMVAYITKTGIKNDQLGQIDTQLSQSIKNLFADLKLYEDTTLISNEENPDADEYRKLAQETSAKPISETNIELILVSEEALIWFGDKSQSLVLKKGMKLTMIYP
jgi:hypothetical protein